MSTNDSRKHIHIKVTGQVQGVFFRASAKRQAQGLGITGIVRNNPDGSVSIEAEGEPETLREFVEWCSIGPSKARVNRVEIEEGGIQHFDTFQVA